MFSMSKDFSLAVPISPNASRWEIDEESISNASSHDELWQLISDRSREIMLSDIWRNLNEQILSNNNSYYFEYKFFSVADPNKPEKSYKFVRVSCLRYMFIHLPKTGGRYFYSNYSVVKHTTGRNHVHPTFNVEHLSTSGLELFPLCGVDNGDGSITHSRLKTFQSFVTIVRNPYDWLASFYFTNDGAGWGDIAHIADKKITFERFIRSICERDDIGKEINRKIYPFDKGITSPLFNISGELCVGSIIFFERMDQGVASLNIKNRDPDEISKSMKSFRQPRGRGDYRNLYTDELKQLVYDKFRFDFEFLGYDFGGLRHEKSHLSFDKPIHKDALVGNLL